MANEDIRKIIVDNGLRYWEVANALGINDGNFSRKLRMELQEDEKDNIIAIIEKLICEKKEGK